MCQTEVLSNGNANGSTENGKTGLKVWRIGVVGGGPSGLSFCLQLFDKFRSMAQSHNVQLHLTVFERSGQVGPGMAYARSGAYADTQLLNVPKDGMTAYAGKFGHFSQWLTSQMADGANVPKWPKGVEQWEFPPRHIFGQYLAMLADKLRKDAMSERCFKIRFMPDMSVEGIEKKSVENGKEYCLKATALNDGQTECFAFDQIVLCTGHLPEDTYRQWIGHSRYVHNGWTRKMAFHQMDPEDGVAILGTKLSAIDICLELRARGHRAPILMCSRTGLLPAVFVPMEVLARKETNGHLSPYGLQIGEGKGIGGSGSEADEGRKAMPKTVRLKNLHGHPTKPEIVFCTNYIPNKCQTNGNLPSLCGIQMVPKQFTKLNNLEGQSSNGSVALSQKFLSQIMADIGREENGEYVGKLAQLMFSEIAAQMNPAKCKFRNYEEAAKYLVEMGPEKWLNWQLREATAQNEHGSARMSAWQLVIFMVYPMLPAMWQRMSTTERRTFYRHFYSLFQSFSAAMPARNGAILCEMIASNQLAIVRDISAIEWDPNNGGGTFQLRGQLKGGKNGDSTSAQSIPLVKWLFNATGPGFSAMNVPLLAQLVHNGMAMENEFGGFHVDTRTFRIMSKEDNEPAADGFDRLNNLFAIGELTKGDLLLTSEMNKVAEQAEKLANIIVADIRISQK